MGAVCCVARNETTSEGTNGEILRRTIQYSPSWGVRWDNRGRVAGEDTPVSVIVENVRQHNQVECKSEPFESNQQKTPLIKDVGSQSKNLISESPGARKIISKVKETIDMPDVLDRTLPTTEPNNHSISYLSKSPLPPKSQLAPACSSQSNWSPHFSKSQILRQRSGSSQLYGPKSLNDFSPVDGISPSSLPVSGIESARGSHGGSLDTWSVQGFSESATSTQEETWSFDNELLGSRCYKLAKSHSRKSDSHSKELKTCVICSKYLLEKSSFGSQKIVPNNELAVVAVLVCGHVYHADCLEHLTPDISKYDPPCPVCTFGEPQAMDMFEKLLKEEMDMKRKKHRSRNENTDIIPLTRGSSPRLEPSSSLRNSFSRPFLKRHFSFGSKERSSSSETSQHPFRKRSLPWSKSSK